MCDGPFSKKVLLLLNGFFLLCGSGLLGIGLWMKFDPMFLHYLHVVNVAASNPFLDTAALLFIVVGAAAFVIAFIGCCGALRESQCLIFLYIVLLFVLIAGEVVGGVLALVYRTEVEGKLEHEMYNQLNEDYFPNNTETYNAWNYLQTELKCCGSYDFNDYRNSRWWNETRTPGTGIGGVVQHVPDVCCVRSAEDATQPKDWNNCQADASQNLTTGEYVYESGCHGSLLDWFKSHSLIMMCLGFGIGAIQLLGFAAACCFRNAMRTTDNYPK